MSKMREQGRRRTVRRGKYGQARTLIEDIVLTDDFTDFMTLVGYEHLE